MSRSILVYLLVVIAACVAAMFLSQPGAFDPACQGQNVPRHCI